MSNLNEDIRRMTQLTFDIKKIGIVNENSANDLILRHAQNWFEQNGLNYHEWYILSELEKC